MKLSNQRFLVTVTYAVEVEVPYPGAAISAATSRIQRNRSSYDTDPEPVVVNFSAQAIPTEGGDAKQAPFMGSAVVADDAPEHCFSSYPTSVGSE
jgi:hypothetical protein